MMRRKSMLQLGAAAIVSAALGTVAFGPSAMGQGAAGPFTQAQVDAGRQAFADNFAACHLADLAGTQDPPPPAGSPLLGAWGKRTPPPLFNKIHTPQPFGPGGSPDDPTPAPPAAHI